MVNRFGRIGVLMGGVSSERSVSLRSGNAVLGALKQAGYDVQAIDIALEDKEKIFHQIHERSIDIAFIALHGRWGEDGRMQSLLEEMGIPYTGTGVKSSQLAYNKALSQVAFAQAGISVPPHVIINDGRAIDFKTAWACLKKTPLVVKAACEGSSLGVHIVRHPSEWEQALKNALSYGAHVIIEQFIRGREFTVGIFDQTPLPVVEIIPKTGFFSFNAKYQQGMTDYRCPALIDPALTSKIQEMSLKAYHVIEGSGFARVDLRVDDQQPFILEINTIPGFTETSLFPKAAAQAGYSFLQVCEKLLELAYAQKRV